MQETMANVGLSLRGAAFPEHKPMYCIICLQGRYVQIVVERQQRERDLREKAEREKADRVNPFSHCIFFSRSYTPLLMLWNAIWAG